MESIKAIFAKPAVKYGLIAVIVILLGYVTYVTIKRSKDRASWISWINSVENNNEWKALLIQQATENGRTLDEQIQYTAYYLHPLNPFKPAQ